MKQPVFAMERCGVQGRICHLVTVSMVSRLDSTLREVRHRQLDLEFQQLKLEEKALSTHNYPSGN